MKHIILFLNLVLSLSLFAQKSKLPFKDRTFRAPTGQGKLFGTLSTPKEGNKDIICVIVPGSGPTDRNGNSGVFVYSNSYKILADSLAIRGFAVLRYDKRGVGESKYVYNSETEMTFDLYTKDVNFIINQIKKEKDFKKIVLIGHSEGSLLSIKAALNDSIAGLISLCGVGRSADSLLLTQLSNLPTDLKEEAIQIVQKINAGQTVENVSKPLMSIFRPSVQPYLRTWFKINPAFEFSKLEIPTLVIQGGTDLQVEIREGQILSAANPKAEYKFIADMNHILKRATSDRTQNIKTYGEPELELHPELVPAIVDFLNRLP